MLTSQVRKAWPDKGHVFLNQRFIALGKLLGYTVFRMNHDNFIFQASEGRKGGESKNEFVYIRPALWASECDWL